MFSFHGCVEHIHPLNITQPLLMVSFTGCFQGVLEVFVSVNGRHQTQPYWLLHNETRPSSIVVQLP